MQLLGLLATRETMLVDLVLNLIRRVGHVYTRIQVGRAHLCLGTLEGGEELGVDQGRFGIFEFDSNVSCQAEVGVLVDGAGDKTGDICAGTEDVGEGVREGRGSLDRAEVDLANVVA